MEFTKINTIIGIDVGKFLQDFISFNDNLFSSVVNYYKGKSRRNPFAFAELDRLEVEAINILTAFKTNQTDFTNLKEWEVLEVIEEINAKLLSAKETAKYLRSSILLAAYNDGIQNKDYILKQNQPLEGVALNELKSENPNDDWADIALDNDLREEDYSTAGFVNLKLNYKNRGTITDVKVVFDRITGDNILGKDIQKRIEFDIVEEDLVTLEPRDTVIQAAGILLSLRRNDNPEFWNDGIPSNLLGVSATTFAYPILFRELENVFSKDDTLKSFQIEEIKNEKDTVVMTLSIETILGEMIQDTLSL